MTTSPDQINAEEIAMTMTPSITVYTSPGCGPCTATKLHLDRGGAEHTVVDVSSHEASRRYITEELGYLRAPVVVHIDHDGQLQHWGGFRPDLLDEAIADLEAVAA